jgi:hypothetical protein
MVHGQQNIKLNENVGTGLSAFEVNVFRKALGAEELK